MASGGSGAVFFLGTRAHYQVLEQPNYEENGNTSTESIYLNTSVEELWPKQTNIQNVKYSSSYGDRINFNYEPNDCSASYENNLPEITSCIKRRIKRRSSEALLCDDIKPSLLNNTEPDDPPKQKPRRVSVLSFLASLASRKRHLREPAHYLQHLQLDSALARCTYRESCRCLDCQGRYFDCAEDSDEYASDNEYSISNCVHNKGIHTLEDSDDEVFINTNPDSDNKSTDMLLDENPSDMSEEPTEEASEETDPQLQLEVAASTSAMLNLLLYHPFSCAVQ